MDINELEKIIGILKLNDVTEFELEQDGTSIKLRRGSHQFHQVVSGATHEVQPAIIAASNGTPSLAAHGPKIDVESTEGLAKVESPIVGTFYRKPSPDADTFVNVGDIVKKGQTLCIVEAMKLMNEIESPCSGKIVKILLSDGQVVEYGEVLFLIDPKA